MDELSTPYEDSKTEKGCITSLAWLFVLTGCCILIYFIHEVSLSHSFHQYGKILNLTNFGAFGDFIAGVVGTIFTLAGFFLLYLTLKDQRDNFHRERLESTFFEMIKLHRENVNEMQYSYFETKAGSVTKVQKVTAEKRKIFKIIFYQFKEAWLELNFIFKETKIEDIYEAVYLSNIRLNRVIQVRDIDLKQLAQIDIIYLIVYFGLSKEDKQNILNITDKRYNKAFINKVLNFAGLKPKRESAFWKQWYTISENNYKIKLFIAILLKRAGEKYDPIIDGAWVEAGETVYPIVAYYPDIYDKYYGGHQFRLGHYFRHIYQTVTFIDDEKYLSPKEKYNYIKILRGQLSNYEQIVFFLNSLSEFGRTWELMNKNNPSEAIQKEKHLISNYNLIKNIPVQLIADEINILNYYPDVKYEIINNTGSKA